MSCRNGIEPLRLPIRNVTVSSDGNAVARGIEAGFGSPQQLMSLSMSFMNSDLGMDNEEQCDDTPAQCAGQLGGIYRSERSNTYQQVTREQWNGTADKDLLSAGFFSFFTETIQLGTNHSYGGFPVIMNGPGYVPSQAELPLGVNSTLLRSTYDGRHAPSTAFGVYAGSNSMLAPEDGLVILGGFDSARVDGEFTEMNYEPCPFCVTIESIEYSNGSNIESLINEPLDARIEASSDSLVLPNESFDRFRSIVGATYNANNYWFIMQEDASLGNLTIKLSNGYTTIIPGYELFSKPRDYDEDGWYWITEQDVTIGLVANTSSSIGTLGLPFISQNYFVIDHERQEWRMGKARTNGGRQAIADPIVAAIEPICAVDDAAPAGSAKSGTNAGAIAGGVVGGILGLALIIFAIWFFRRRKARHNIKKRGGTAADETGTLPPAYEKSPKVLDVPDDNDKARPTEMSTTGQSDPRFSMSELPGATAHPAEISPNSDGDPRYSMSELPGARTHPVELSPTSPSSDPRYSMSELPSTIEPSSSGSLLAGQSLQELPSVSESSEGLTTAKHAQKGPVELP